MIKLNNKGWGLRSMLVFLLFLFFLGFIVYSLIIKLNNILDTNVKTKSNYFNNNNIALTFESLENKLRKAATKYQTTDLIITSNTLIENNLLDNLNDVTDNTPCTGYVDNKTKTPFVSCTHYQTIGYKE